MFIKKKKFCPTLFYLIHCMFPYLTSQKHAPYCILYAPNYSQIHIMTAILVPVLFYSSSSVGATTLGGFWLALRFRSTIFYIYTSLSSFSLSSSLNPLLLDQAISVLVFLLVLMNIVPIQLIF